MNNLSFLIEYFDELFPVLSGQKVFYEKLTEKYGMPTRFLRIGCGTGYFEHYLAKEGHDVTGLEVSREMLERANLRRRLPNMAIRYFQMSYLDMTRFLGKKFYNVISCLNDEIIHVHDETLRRKFFYDCRALLKDDGIVVLQLLNYKKFVPKPMVKLPNRESIRAKLFTQLWAQSNGTYTISQDLENSAGKVIPISSDVKVYPATVEELEKAALENGFTKVEKFKNFDLEPFNEDSDMTVLVIS